MGGTSIGKELFELRGEAYTVLRDKFPSLHMVLVTGPGVATEAVRAPKGVEVRQFINRLYELFAAWIIIPSTPPASSWHPRLRAGRAMSENLWNLGKLKDVLRAFY